MSWVRLDDGFWRNPKVIRLLSQSGGPEALSLHVLALTFCGENLTDGLVEKPQLRVLVRWPTQRITQRTKQLLNAHLWDEVAPGLWRIHDYLDYNPSAKEVQAKRVSDKERQRRHRLLSRRDLTRDLTRPEPEPQFDDEYHHQISPVNIVDNLSNETDAMSNRLAGYCDSHDHTAARRVVVELLESLDPRTVDELIGTIRAKHIRRPEYLLTVARSQGLMSVPFGNV